MSGEEVQLLQAEVEPAHNLPETMDPVGPGGENPEASGEDVRAGASSKAPRRRGSAGPRRRGSRNSGPRRRGSNSNNKNGKNSESCKRSKKGSHTKGRRAGMSGEEVQLLQAEEEPAHDAPETMEPVGLGGENLEARGDDMRARASSKAPRRRGSAGPRRRGGSKNAPRRRGSQSNKKNGKNGESCKRSMKAATREDTG